MAPLHFQKVPRCNCNCKDKLYKLSGMSASVTKIKDFLKYNYCLICSKAGHTSQTCRRRVHHHRPTGSLRRASSLLSLCCGTPQRLDSSTLRLSSLGFHKASRLQLPHDALPIFLTFSPTSTTALRLIRNLQLFMILVLLV